MPRELDRPAVYRPRRRLLALRLVAEALGLSAKCARVVAGTTSARKGLEISGLSESELRDRLAKAVAP